MAGQVLVGDVPISKSGQMVDEESLIRLRGEVHPFVSRGGVKISTALDSFKIVVDGKVALDIGASTGGFTQVLLLRGAQRVHAVDVGYNQLDWILRNDPRVIVHEKINARDINYSVIGELVDIISIDVSFISIEKIIPATLKFATKQTNWITLIKPQFEVGKGRVSKGGIVKDKELHQEVIERIGHFCESIGLNRLDLIESPITGTDGNKEFLAHWKIK